MVLGAIVLPLEVEATQAWRYADAKRLKELDAGCQCRAESQMVAEQRPWIFGMLKDVEQPKVVDSWQNGGAA